MEFRNILKGKDNPDDFIDSGDPGTCVPLDEFDSVSKEAMLDIRARARASGLAENIIDRVYPLA